MAQIGSILHPARELRRFVRENPRARRVAKAAIRELSFAVAKRSYEASKKGRRTEGWLAGNGSANSLVGNSLTTGPIDPDL